MDLCLLHLMLGMKITKQNQKRKEKIKEKKKKQVAKRSTESGLIQVRVVLMERVK